MTLQTREALEAALAHLPAISGTATDRHSMPADRLLIVSTAARKQLALMPEKCGTCGGKGTIYKVEDDGSRSGRMCSVCHGSGNVYSAELVELIASAIYAGSYSGGYQEQALAVLDALGETE